jgi:DNA repair protein RecO (recombination protein O)
MWLDGAEEKYANFHLLFLLRLTRFLRISPNLQTDSGAHYFDLQAGCFVGVQPLHANYLTATQAADFFSLMAYDYNEASRVAMNRTTRNEYLTVIQNYYRLHLPDFPELKSAEVLKELFA